MSLVVPVQGVWDWFVGAARAPRVRTMRRFAEEEVVIPDGPHEGERFRCETQPYAGLFFDAVDSGQWRVVVATGPSQTGKTLTCFVTPTLYHLFECRETVICGLPLMDMAGDKWREDLLPAIEASRYRGLLPRKGPGSRGGGNPSAVQFGNGATLRFMTGGAGDKARAGYTARVVVITETDGMDAAGEASKEADPITQLIARTRAYGDRARVYMECTLSTDQGRTWVEYQAGTASRLMGRCPSCREWVKLAPDTREECARFLRGWQEADNEVDARALSTWTCFGCGAPWTEGERREVVRGAVLVHGGEDGGKGKDMPAGTPAFPAKTEVLGFRWSAPANLFLPAGQIGVDEWRGARSSDEDNAERSLRQFVWCLPYEGTETEMANLDQEAILARGVGPSRGVCAAGTQWVTVGVDVGKWLLHWVAVGWRDVGPEQMGTPHVVDYGVVEVPSRDLSVRQALPVAFNQVGEIVLGGFPVSETGEVVQVRASLIDAGWEPDAVYDWIRKSRGPFWPSHGWGSLRNYAGEKRLYSSPKTKSKLVLWVGDGLHVQQNKAKAIRTVEYNADAFKALAHDALSIPVGEAGALTLYRAGRPLDHMRFAKHMLAERQVQEWEAGKGYRMVFEQVARDNHWLDALAMALAGHAVARGVEASRRRVASTVPAPGGVGTGQPYFIGDRR